MSTEQKHDPETTALAEKLSHWWTLFKQGKLLSYRVMAIILISVTAIGGYLYFRSAKVVETSKTWVELETKNSLSSLKDFAKANPNSLAGQVAEFQIARYQLGAEGIEKLSAAQDEAQRKKAIENVEEGRDTLARLAEQFKNDPVLRAECYLGLAKAEAALIGLTKENSIEFRGSIKALSDHLDKLAEVADGTPWGEDAKKLSAALKAPSSTIGDELLRVQIGLYKLEPQLLPGVGPQSPSGGPPPFSIPGVPGGSPGMFGAPFSPGPIAPEPSGVIPPSTPAPSPPKAPDAPAPSPKSTAPTTPGSTPPGPKPPEGSPPGPKPTPTPPVPAPQPIAPKK